MQFDILIKGGRLIDPANQRDGSFDIAVTRGRIAAVDVDIPADRGRQVIDASSQIVTPGLVDMHAHVMYGFSSLGIDADELGARTGVTTMVDPGTVGAFTLPGFRTAIVERARTNLYALLNISSVGLVGADYELARLEWCSVPLFEKMAKANGDLVVGLKVRMGVPQFPILGIEPLKRARQAADLCALPIMLHIAWPPPAIEDVLEYLKEGDIVTHCCTALGMKLVDDGGKVKEAVRAARDRGVILDIGHGSGSFAFGSAERLIAAGSAPDTISTDAHQPSVQGPMFDLPTCMSKMLMLGMSLPDVVRAATVRPAEVLGLPRDIGRLDVGGAADIAVFDLVEGDFPVFDFSLEERRAKEMLVNALTIKDGRIAEPGAPLPPAPWAKLTGAQQDWYEARRRDPRAPHTQHLYRPEHFDEPTPVERDATPLPREL